MWANDFSLNAALAAASCPRCYAFGLIEIDTDTYRAAVPENRHQAKFLIDPSVPARCPACGLVMEWPGCCA